MIYLSRRGMRVEAETRFEDGGFVRGQRPGPNLV
jgi:hypothetical protein